MSNDVFSLIDDLISGSDQGAEAKHNSRLPEVEGSEWRALRVFSHVLEREIFVRWKGHDPRVVHVDRTPYTLEEIATLKNGDPQAVRAVHETKEFFEGKVIKE